MPRSRGASIKTDGFFTVAGAGASAAAGAAAFCTCICLCLCLCRVEVFALSDLGSAAAPASASSAVALDKTTCLAVESRQHMWSARCVAGPVRARFTCGASSWPSSSLRRIVLCETPPHGCATSRTSSSRPRGISSSDSTLASPPCLRCHCPCLHVATFAEVFMLQASAYRTQPPLSSGSFTNSRWRSADAMSVAGEYAADEFRGRPNARARATMRLAGRLSSRAMCKIWYAE
mmetsp:Transcript_13936/g.58165  ORF Transcript_13936/g.58165 Transcript_13936/m.58165 type:complete len:233 (+) Transcript_13936:549-1247(+)